jgi:hypothetical protein
MSFQKLVIDVLVSIAVSLNQSEREMKSGSVMRHLRLVRGVIMPATK